MPRSYGYKKLFVTYVVAIRLQKALCFLYCSHKPQNCFSPGYGSLGYGYQGIAQVMATTYDLDDFSKKARVAAAAVAGESDELTECAPIVCSHARDVMGGKNA